jgi:hypothetical protein
MTVKLDIRQHQQQWVVFNLSWGDGQYLSAELPYPSLVCERYQEWHTAYLNFYRRLVSAPSPVQFLPPTTDELRGRVAESGSFSATEDWRSQLVQSEAQLLTEFHRWLNSAQLIEIRRQIVQLATHSPFPDPHLRYFDLFLSCNARELDHLPWEVWEMGGEFAATSAIRIARIPKTIRSPVRSANRSAIHTHRHKPRILVILGDETGLNFQTDRQAVQSLAKLSEIQFIGWQPDQDGNFLLTQIAEAIADPQGWDCLFFAGHSNETALTGGKLAIAPSMAISISEIMPHLKLACARGLQFALFNSCNGLSIAESLVDLGISQVVVMREPIHNQVAQEFLIQFLRELAEFKDIHESLTGVCQSLKCEKHLTYPSAHLVPSLFRHPSAELFRLHPTDLKSRLRPWLPTRIQAASLLILSLLSLMLPLQGKLLEQRLWMQSLYRHITQQGTAPTPPSITLVQIDSQSIQAAKLTQAHPMDRSYLATLFNRLTALNAEIVGVDYLFDRPAAQPEKDRELSQAIRAAVQQPPQAWYVFVSMQENGEWVSLRPDLVPPNQSLIGDMHLLTLNNIPLYMKTVTLDRFHLDNSTHKSPLPFSFLLSFAREARSPSQADSANLTQNPNELLPSILNRSPVLIPDRAQLQPLTAFSYQFNQLWLHPIIDFSIPPDQIYQPISAEKLLTDSTLPSLQGQIVILAAGIYKDAGIIPGQDSYPMPTAARHWRKWRGDTKQKKAITGGEIHAYMTHAFLTNRLVVPIPDLWMIGIAALLGKAITLAKIKPLRWRWLLGATVIYGLFSLQVYISAAILLPLLLPTLAFWTYILPACIGSSPSLPTSNTHPYKGAKSP